MNILTAPPATNNSETVTIRIAEVIGDNLFIACEDGEKVRDRIAETLQSGKKAIVSFKDGQDVTSAFLADAIARLYATFPEELLESSVSIVDIEPLDAADLNYAIALKNLS